MSAQPKAPQRRLGGLALLALELFKLPQLVSLRNHMKASSVLALLALELFKLPQLDVKAPGRVQPPNMSKFASALHKIVIWEPNRQSATCGNSAVSQEIDKEGIS